MITKTENLFKHARIVYVDNCRACANDDGTWNIERYRKSWRLIGFILRPGKWIRIATNVDLVTAQQILDATL